MINVPKNATSENRKVSMPTLTGERGARWEKTDSSAACVICRSSRHSYFQSGSSGCFRSQSGRRLRTVGIVSKLYEGGGDVVAHSSVQASHGSSPAGAPVFREKSRFHTKIR